jgi:hypothetical protein
MRDVPAEPDFTRGERGKVEGGLFYSHPYIWRTSSPGGLIRLAGTHPVFPYQGSRLISLNDDFTLCKLVRL